MLLSCSEHRRFGGLQHTLQAPQQSKRQDNAAILRLLEIAAQKVRHRPDKSSQLRMALCIHNASPPALLGICLLALIIHSKGLGKAGLCLPVSGASLEVRKIQVKA